MICEKSTSAVVVMVITHITVINRMMMLTVMMIMVMMIMVMIEMMVTIRDAPISISDIGILALKSQYRYR